MNTLLTRSEEHSVHCISMRNNLSSYQGCFTERLMVYRNHLQLENLLENGKTDEINLLENGKTGEINLLENGKSTIFAFVTL